LCAAIVSKDMPPKKPRKIRGGNDGSSPVMPLSTLPPGPGAFETLGIACGQAVGGVNIVKDIFGAVTDIVGGYSETYENSIRSARERALAKMQDDARARFGNSGDLSIHGVFVQFGNISEAKMVVVTASGTVVRAMPMSVMSA